MSRNPSHRRSTVPADLASHEEVLAARFGALSRAAVPASLRARCLEPGSQVGRLGPCRPAPRSATWTRRLALAASVLVALGTLALAGSSGAARPGPEAVSADLASAGTRLRVVDDPSVPLFHGVETFDQLAAVGPSGGGSAGERGGR